MAMNEQKQFGRPPLGPDKAEVDMRLKLPPYTYAWLCRIATRYDLHVNVVARKMLVREAERLAKLESGAA